MQKTILLFCLFAGFCSAEVTRLKDLVSIEGVRDNQLMGLGVVAGLRGTGDTQMTLFSNQALANMLKRMGLTVDPTLMQVHDMAAVMVSATLPAFAQPGMKIDVTVSTIGDSKSLQGGVLLMTPLKAGDGQVYAVAQGPVVTGAFIAGRNGTTQTLNHPTVGRALEGGIVERAPPTIEPAGHFKLQLHQADFTTASRVVDLINHHFSGDAVVAHAESAGVVVVEIPPSYITRPVEFVAEIENLTVDADQRARVVINERTGTIVVGKEVRIAPVVIMHGSLNVQISTKMDVSQPLPMSSGGQTKLVPNTTVKTNEEPAKSLVLQKGATIEDLVRALQAIGSTPRDVIEILQALRAEGALDAEIEVN